MKDLLRNLATLITPDYIALLSVIITVLIFVISRRSELKYKKYDDRKNQYRKLIELLNDIFMNSKKDEKSVKPSVDKKTPFQITDKIKAQFFDVGSSLLLYGSKKLYRQYIFFREFTLHPYVPHCKYYNDNLVVYLMADMLTTMRKEVGLSSFNTVQSQEALSFFMNDMSNNPIAKANAYDAKFRIRMIKFELFLLDRINFTWIKSIYFKLIKPIFGFLALCWKYLFLIPLGKILNRLFPTLMDKIGNPDMSSKD